MAKPTKLQQEIFSYFGENGLDDTIDRYGLVDARGAANILNVSPSRVGSVMGKSNKIRYVIAGTTYFMDRDVYVRALDIRDTDMVSARKQVVDLSSKLSSLQGDYALAQVEIHGLKEDLEEARSAKSIAKMKRMETQIRKLAAKVEKVPREKKEKISYEEQVNAIYVLRVAAEVYAISPAARSAFFQIVRDYRQFFYSYSKDDDSSNPLARYLMTALEEEDVSLGVLVSRAADINHLHAENDLGEKVRIGTQMDGVLEKLCELDIDTEI